jgi:hypothetical protein
MMRHTDLGSLFEIKERLVSIDREEKKIDVREGTQETSEAKEWLVAGKNEIIIEWDR